MFTRMFIAAEFLIEKLELMQIPIMGKLSYDLCFSFAQWSIYAAEKKTVWDMEQNG